MGGAGVGVPAAVPPPPPANPASTVVALAETLVVDELKDDTEYEEIMEVGSDG